MLSAAGLAWLLAYRTDPLLSPSAPFDKTANITFSLNADDENVSATWPWLWAGRAWGS